MNLRKLLSPALFALPLTACPVEPSAPPAQTTTTTSTTTTSTTTTTVPDGTLVYTGTADKTAGCFSGAGGDDAFQQALGDDGWFDFALQGCTAGAGESVSLWDPAGGPVGDAFKSPSDHMCKLGIVGTDDETNYYRDQIAAPADTGGQVILSSTNSWPVNVTWQITCIYWPDLPS